MLTPEVIDNLTWNITELYLQCEYKLINLILKKAKSGADLLGNDLDWDLKKLNDFGGLKKDTAKLISKTGTQAKLALARLVKEITAKAIGKEPATGVMRAVQGLQAQAISSLNLVNTVMFAGTVDKYGELVSLLTNERNKALNEGAMYLVTGVKNFRSAVSNTIKELSDSGITAYQDTRQRNWTSEAYVSMDLRTTSANVERTALQAQANDVGLHIYQVSSHAGARPKCAVCEGKFYSDNGTSGEIEDAYGNRYHYIPQEQADYWGEPDGLFGINCGHDRIYVSDGFYKRRDTLSSEQLKANQKEYALSQQQRSIERAIRTAKREEQSMRTSGYTDKADTAMSEKYDLENEYKKFCKETGRTPRWNRTEIY